MNTEIRRLLDRCRRAYGEKGVSGPSLLAILDKLEAALLAASPAPTTTPVACSCGGVMYGDGHAHTRECAAYEGAKP